MNAMAAEIEPRRFRDVLGHYPTGVCVVTATTEAGSPVGVTVGSFTSMSLNPPLVGFAIDTGSTTWPQIEATGAFCVNVLAASQERVCRAMAAKNTDKFESVTWWFSRFGSPLIDGAVAWVECGLDSIVTAGDHLVVIGRVTDLAAVSTDSPLLFHRGGFGGFVPHPRLRVAADPEASLASWSPLVAV